MKDPIERQDAIDAFEDTTYTKNEIRRRITELPSAQQDCTECAEYDQTTKSCPKYCDVIRQTLEEAKQERTGRWELIDDTEFRIPGYRCSICHCECEDWDKKPTYRFCPNCGARMEGTDEID